jgi:hypothetical protein
MVQMLIIQNFSVLGLCIVITILNSPIHTLFNFWYSPSYIKLMPVPNLSEKKEECRLHSVNMVKDNKT